MIVPNEAQKVRDTCGLATYCAACGHPETARNPLVLAGDGYRVHVAHVITPGDGYYGVPFADEARPGRAAISSPRAAGAA
jgi:hypothetical protein